MTITIVSASVREGRLSHNAAVMLEQQLSQRGHEVNLIDLKEVDFPPLDYVLDKSPSPNAAYLRIRENIKAADALLFVSPEYNGSYTAALKNMVDHLGKLDFAKKVIGISVPTTGVMGGMRAALAMQELVLAIWALPIPQMLLVPQVDKKIDATGQIIDPMFEKTVSTFLNEYLWVADAVAVKKAQPALA